jgi:beta-lactamase regulating signal transducer with metallopeptidase domain
MMSALLDHLWQSTLVAGAAGLLTVLLRRNGAGVRYAVWFAASLKFLVPFSVLIALGRQLAPTVRIVQHPLIASTQLERLTAPFAAVGGAPGTPLHAASGHAVLTLASIAGVVWLAGVLAVLAFWLSRWMRIRAMLRGAADLPITAPIPVKSASGAIEPGLIGILQPVLLLPEGLSERLSEQELQAVVAHELCHMRRRDNLTAAVHMIVEALFWFFPLTWWLGARLIDERERACDEAVLSGGNEADAYAESILKVCKFYLHSPVACVAGVSGADLRRRVETIMSGCKTDRVGGFKRAVLAVALGAAFVVPATFGLLTARAVASDTPASSATPTADEIAQQRYEQARPRTEIPYDAKDFDKFVGYYRVGSASAIVHITRDGEHYFMQPTGGVNIEIYPDSPTEFFLKVAPVQVEFVSNSGVVTGLVVHQGGLLQRAEKIDEATAKAVQAELAQRIQSKTPSPGTEAAVRHQLDTLWKGQQDYSVMSPGLAAAAHAQASIMAQMVEKLGAFQTLTFKGVAPQGADIYEATFANGQVEVTIAPLGDDGKIQGLLLRAVP